MEYANMDFWDDINVGDIDMNDSDAFFAIRHFNHDRQPQNLNQELPSQTIEADLSSTSENLAGNENRTILSDSNVRQPANILKTENFRFKQAREQALAMNKEKNRAYEFAEIYKKRREARIQKMEREDRENRKVVAKPMPNFSAIHRKTQQLHGSDKPLISPKTPDVLKRGLAMKEKLKKKQEEYERQLAERPPIVARSADAVHAEPFKPKPNDNHVIVVKPFVLHLTDRLSQRKVFDEKNEREQALKREREERQKREEEEKLAKEARQLTIFKANPNPFSK